MKEEADRIVLITGGRTGIGRSLAEAFLRRGATVIVTSRGFESNRSLQAAESEFPDARGAYIPARLEVREEASAAALFEDIDRKFGRLDVLVNNAGRGIFKPFGEFALEEWREILDVNLTGAFLCSRLALALMEKNGGRIINMGSVAGKFALPDNSVYGASKFGLRGLSLILSAEYAPRGIGVTLISAGAVRGAFWGERPGFDAGRMLAPEDLARVILDVALTPLGVRIDEIDVTPPEGIL